MASLETVCSAFFAFPEAIWREENAGFLGIYLTVGGGHGHLGDGVLDGSAIFEVGELFRQRCRPKEARLGGALLEARMEVAVGLAAQGGGAAFPARGLDVTAFWSHCSPP